MTKEQVTTSLQVLAGFARRPGGLKPAAKHRTHGREPSNQWAYYHNTTPMRYRFSRRPAHLPPPAATLDRIGNLHTKLRLETGDGFVRRRG